MRVGRQRRLWLAAVLTLVAVLIIVPRLGAVGLFSSYLHQLEALAWLNYQPPSESLISNLKDLARLDELEEENQRLRAVSGFMQQKAYQYRVGYILSRDPVNQNLVTISLGSSDGLLSGQPLIVSEGLIIGKITQVSEHKALAELLTSDQSRLAVKSIGADKTTGLVFGSVGSSLSMQFIPTEINLAPGDVIITSGLEDRIPAGLIVGLVDKIQTKETELFKTAVVLPATNYQQQDLVSVIVGS